MSKRILGATIAAVLVLGLAGMAFAAASPGRPEADLGAEALQLAADAGTPGAPSAGKRDELRACVRAKVDGGAERKAAVQECAAQLGVDRRGLGKPGKPGRQDRRGQPGQGARDPGLGRAAHAEAVVPKVGADGQWETVVLDRGTVTAAAADAISLQRPDGPTVTVKVAAGTKVRGAASAADLDTGREVVVVSAGGEARSIVARR